MLTAEYLEDRQGDAIIIASIITPTSIIPRISTEMSTIEVAIACTTDIHRKCKSRSTIASGTTSIPQVADTTGVITSSRTYSNRS